MSPYIIRTTTLILKITRLNIYIWDIIEINYNIVIFTLHMKMVIHEMIIIITNFSLAKKQSGNVSF